MIDVTPKQLQIPLRPRQMQLTVRYEVTAGVLWIQAGFKCKSVRLHDQFRKPSVVERGQLELASADAEPPPSIIDFYRINPGISA